MTKDEQTPKDKRKKKDDMRYGGTQSLAAIIPNLARKAVGKRGFMDARILNEWPMIVGADLSRHAHPDRLTFPRGRRDGGTLHIRALGPMATELQHLEPVLVDRINSHFGYRAVSGIKLLQAPPTRTPAVERRTEKRKPAPPPADSKDLADLDHRLESVEDPELRAILRRLGEGILRRNARQ